MKKGFITIATGSKKYYEMAKILVRSYKLSTKDPMPFAIITDTKDEKFSEFDDVVIIENAKCSYMDKIDLVKNSPYNESIFIDSDCIAYNDLNIYWDDFYGASDFSAYGQVIDSTSGQKGWFEIEDTWKYMNTIKYSINLHGGIYFFKKSEKNQNIYETCIEILENYGSFKFKNFKKPADEPVIALAMAVNGALPQKAFVDRFCFLKNGKKIRADFFSHSLSY